MNEIEILINLPLDKEGFIRRECPSCKQEFKWLAKTDSKSELATHYFCPLCGKSAKPDSWWTPAQVEYEKGKAEVEMDRGLQNNLHKILPNSKNMSLQSSSKSVPDITEPDDMVIRESPCHKNEPFKIPENYTKGSLYCYICGNQFSI